MSLKIIPGRHGSPNFYIRGTVRGIPVDESTGTDDREAAEAIRIRREAELLNRSVYGIRATTTFIEAAVSYMEAGGEARFLRRLIDYFGTLPLASIGQGEIDKAARSLFPGASPSRRRGPDQRDRRPHRWTTARPETGMSTPPAGRS